MKYLTAIPLFAAASLSLSADSIPISASRSADATAILTSGGLSINPGSAIDPVYIPLGGKILEADARAGVYQAPIGHPFAINTGGNTLIGVNAVTGNMKAFVWVNDEGAGDVYDGDAKLRMFYRFELAEAHDFVFASSRTDTAPGEPINWSFDSSLTVRKDGGATTVYDTDVPAQIFGGRLEPGVYEVEYVNQVESAGTYSTPTLGLAIIESRFIFGLQQVPDEGGSLIFAVLAIGSGLLIRRRMA